MIWKGPYFTITCVIRESLSLPCSLLYSSFSLSIICSLALVVSLSFVCYVCVCLCTAYMPLDTFATDYGMTQMQVEQGASPVANCTYFWSQDLQASFREPPHL